MLDKQVNRLPVVRGGRLAGIVTRSDIVRAFARTDEAIEREVREAIDFQEALVHDGSPVAVAVADGEAILTGSVRAHSQADRLAQVAAGVPGVMAVRSELGWTEDAVTSER
jgi:osmotically-inducible protein OsmY